MAIPAVSPRFPARALHYGLHSPTSGFWSSTTSSKCGKPCLQTGLWALLCWVSSKKLGSPGLISHLLGQGPEALTAARAQLLALWLEAGSPGTLACAAKATGSCSFSAESSSTLTSQAKGPKQLEDLSSATIMDTKVFKLELPPWMICKGRMTSQEFYIVNACEQNASQFRSQNRGCNLL